MAQNSPQKQLDQIREDIKGLHDVMSKDGETPTAKRQKVKQIRVHVGVAVGGNVSTSVDTERHDLEMWRDGDAVEILEKKTGNRQFVPFSNIQQGFYINE